MGRREHSLSDDVTGQCHFCLGQSAVSARPLVRMHRQRACNLKSDELLRQLQDIPEDESDASDDVGDEDEDYEPPKVASDSSGDFNAEDTCRLEEDLEDGVQQQVMPAMNVGQAECST